LIFRKNAEKISPLPFPVKGERIFISVRLPSPLAGISANLIIAGKEGVFKKFSLH
jgi:hypothetical protein